MLKLKLLTNILIVSSILPFHIEHILPNDVTDALMSQYNISIEADSGVNNLETSNSTSDVPFQNVVITDVDAHTPPHKLCAATL